MAVNFRLIFKKLDSLSPSSVGFSLLRLATYIIYNPQGREIEWRRTNILLSLKEFFSLVFFLFFFVFFLFFLNTFLIKSVLFWVNEFLQLFTLEDKPAIVDLSSVHRQENFVWNICLNYTSPLNCGRYDTELRSLILLPLAIQCLS